MDALLTDTLASHHGLEERLARAKVAHPSRDPEHPREQFPAVDTFLSAASQHNAALLDVLVPAARTRLPHGAQRASEFVAASRHYEHALNAVKAKLYHSAHAPHATWASVWAEVDEAFRTVWKIELALVADLASARTASDPDWAERLHRSELTAPTRPHPHIPHQGVAGQAARAVARRVDAFWDAAEGRMTPRPTRARDRAHDSLLTQYLLGDPHMADAPPSSFEGEPRRSARTGWPLPPVEGPTDPHLDGEGDINRFR